MQEKMALNFCDKILAVVGESQPHKTALKLI
jgi:hypothetical protein